MKYFIIIFLILNTFITRAEEHLNFKTKEIQTNSIAEEFYDKLEVRTNLPKMLNKYIDKKALVRTEVPQSLWKNIKNNVEYDSFKAEVIVLIQNFNTNQELQSIIDFYAYKPNVPISKLSFRKELANVVEAFYQDFVATANNTLTSNNYEPL